MDRYDPRRGRDRPQFRTPVGARRIAAANGGGAGWVRRRLLRVRACRDRESHVRRPPAAQRRCHWCVLGLHIDRADLGPAVRTGLVGEARLVQNKPGRHLAVRQLAHAARAVRLLQLHHDLEHRLCGYHDHWAGIEYAGLARSDVRAVLSGGGGREHRGDEARTDARAAARGQLALRVTAPAMLSKWRSTRRHWALIGGLAALALCGCSTIKHMLHMDRGAQAASQRAQQLLILQFRIMRFADGYVGAIIEPVQHFREASNSPEERFIAQNWLVSQATAAYTIATGPSAVVNALDMVVLATLSRMVIDDDWITERFGERATPLRVAYRSLEAQARDLAKEAVTPDQFAQLQKVIDEWRAQNPHIAAVSYVHFSDFAKSIGHPSPSEVESSTGVFHMLGIDPLSGLDPAVRELAQTREFGERAIFWAQRLPNLVDMQAELVA